jgi:hypothetical protein
MGDLAKDEVTGFEGLVTAHIRHLTGCDTVWLTSQTETHEGKAIERHFDVTQLKLMATNPLKIQGFPKQVESAG